jgi:hypothetical protein
MEFADYELVRMYLNGNCPQESLDYVCGLRDKSIEIAKTPSILTKSTSSTKGVLENIIRLYGEEKLKKEIEGKTVIELGPAHNPNHYIFLKQLGAKEYIGVDLFNDFIGNCFTNTHSKAKVVKEEALSFLIKQPSESAIVVSFGFLCNALHADNEHFVPFVSREIYRITPKNGISVHQGVYELKTSLPGAGFSTENVTISGNRSSAIFYGVFNK